MSAVKSSTVPRAVAPERRFDSLEQEAYLNLWRTYDRLKAVEEEVFSAFDLSAQQYNALRLLRDAKREGLPTLALAARLVSRAPDITRLVDRLEARSLVRRERLADNRRVVRVLITDDGDALLERMSVPVVECAERQLGHLPAAALRSLVAMLKDARRPHEAPDTADSPIPPE